MFSQLSLLLLLLAGSSQALNCAECINEMHGLSFMVKQGAPDMMVRPFLIIFLPSYNIPNTHLLVLAKLNKPILSSLATPKS